MKKQKSNQVTNCTGADEGIDSHDKVAAIEFPYNNAGRMHNEADEQENECKVLEASDCSEQTTELANDDCKLPECCEN